MTALTRDQQIQGQQRLLTASWFNPLGSGIIMGPLVGLLALYYGANDLAMGLIYAGIYLTSITAVMPILFFSRFDFSRIISWVWLIRAVIGGGFLFLPLIEDNNTKIVLVVMLLYGFLFTRAIGATTAPPIFKALNRSGELTSFTASIWSRWYLGLLITTVLSYVVLQNKDVFPSEEMAYMALLAFAFIFNILTALLYFRIPPTGRLSGHGLISLARAAQYIRRKAENRDVMIVGFMQVSLAIVAGYQLSHIKGPLEFSAGYVFALTLGGFIGAFAMAQLVRLLGNSISFRSLLFLTHFTLALCGVCWLSLDYFSVEMQQVLAALLYMVATAMLAMSATVLSAMTSAQLPDHLRLEVSTVYLLNMTFSALCALGIIALMRWLFEEQMNNPYGFVYIIWIALSVGICIWALVRHDNNGPNILFELRQLRPSNIQSIYAMQRLQQTDTRHGHHRVREIENALITDTPATRENLMYFLQSCHFTERLAACRSLLERPYEEANPLLWQEAADRYSPIRGDAITALGFCGDRSYIPKLQSLLDDDDPITVSNALKSLLRMDAALSDEAVLDYYQQLEGSRNRLQVIIGLSENKRTQALVSLLTMEGRAGADQRWLITLALQCADSLGQQARLATLLDLEGERSGSGIEDLLREAAGANALWQHYLEVWQQQSDHGQFMQILPELEYWPVRDHVDLLLQLHLRFASGSSLSANT